MYLKHVKPGDMFLYMNHIKEKIVTRTEFIVSVKKYDDNTEITWWRVFDVDDDLEPPFTTTLEPLDKFITIDCRVIRDGEEIY